MTNQPTNQPTNQRNNERVVSWLFLTACVAGRAGSAKCRGNDPGQARRDNSKENKMNYLGASERKIFVVCPGFRQLRLWKEQGAYHVKRLLNPY
jgi:hypothetical protein